MAQQLANLLVDDRDPPLEVLWEKKAVDFGGEAGAESVHVDDAIVRLKSGKCVYVQVKETCPQGGWSAKQLVRSSIARQFWQQWMSKTPEDRTHTVLRLASRGDLTTLELIVDAALRSRTPQELLGDESSAEIADEISTLAVALDLTSDSADLLAFLKCIQAEQLRTASQLETSIAQSLVAFGEHAPDLARILIRMVGRSKHPGHVARSHFTRETLVAALRENGVAENKLIAAGVVRAKPIDDNVWHRYRDQIVTRFRSFRVYGLHVDRDVYADLPALFVPLRLAPIPSDRALYKDGRRARAMRSLAERLSAEDERALDHTSDSDDERPPNKGNVLDLAAVLAEKRRFAIVGGPGVGKTTTLKWLAITSTLPGDEGQRLRLVYGLPAEPLIPVYVRFRQFAERLRAEGLAGVEGRVGLVADFLRAELQAGLAGELPPRERALQMAWHVIESDKSLFLFDGLDEVADEGMRIRLFEAVADLMKAYEAPRVVVTSRPYAFRRERSPLDLALFEPLPLDREARRTFAQQWYRAVRRNLAAPLEEPEARARADDLARAADSLSDLSEVPLLLSILALVHFNRQGLPIERATLYDYATRAMLGHWERDPGGRDLGDDAVPADWARRLQLNETEIRRVVEHLAQHIQVHAGGGEFGRADAVARLTEGLEFSSAGYKPDAEDRGELLLRLLIDRSGLVQERSPDVFAFVHLSFQEYLTARWFIGRRDAGLQELARLSADERHGEVCRLAVGILSTDHGVEKDERAASLIKAVGLHSPALAAACLLEAPRVRLEGSYSERLARAAFSECTDPRGHYYSWRVIARLIWALLKPSSEPDRVLLEILSDSGDRFPEHPFHRMKGRDFDDREFRHFRPHEMPAFAIVAARPPRPLTPELAWLFRHLSSSHRDSAAGLPRHLAELLLIEAGEAQPLDHVLALVNLLANDDGGSERSSVEGLLLPRVEHILGSLWGDGHTRTRVREVLANSLSLKPARDDGSSRKLAWGAAKFLISRGEWTVPGVADTVISAGLYLRSRHVEAIPCLHTLANEPAAREATLRALKGGLESADSDVRRGCFRVLVDLGLIPPVAAGLDDDAEMLRKELLADSAAPQETIAILAEHLWSEESATAWRVAKALVDSGNAAIPGVPQAIANAGLSVARTVAMQYVRQLHGDPTLNMSVRGALFGALTSTNDPVSTSAGLLLLELEGTDNQRLVRRLTRAVLRDPDQIDDVLPHLRRLIHDERASPAVLETIGERFGEKPSRRVASAVARMLAGEGLTGVRNLAKALVQHGLYQEMDHKEIGEYLKRMLDDPEIETTTRRILFESLSSDVGNVAWGAACSLWEAGSRVGSKIAQVLAGSPGLGTSGRTEQARAWLLELLDRPRTANVARESLEHAASRALHPPRGRSRNLDHALAAAECLITAGALHANNLAEAMIVGGFQRRDDYSKVLNKIEECIARNAEFAVQVEEALWDALDDESPDVRWGAARALIERGSVRSNMLQEVDDDGVDDEDEYSRNGNVDKNEHVKRFSLLWRVLIRESANEPLASKATATLSQKTERSSVERRALLKLLKGDDPEVACAAAYRLLNQKDEDLPAAAMVLVKHGLTDENRRGEAVRALGELFGQPALAPLVVDALNRALWTADDDAAWAAAMYLLEQRHAVNPGILRAMIFGGLLTRRWREAQTRLRGLLSDREAWPAVIDALNVAMYADNERRSFAARLLVEAGAPLHDRIVATLDEVARWQPWVPLALLALTRRQEEAREAATRLRCVELIDLLG